MKTIQQLTFSLLLVLSMLSYAQVTLQNGNMGLHTTNPEGVLDVVSTASGIIPPRVANVDAVTTPINGMIVYDLSEHCLRGYANNEWSYCLGSSSSDSQLLLLSAEFTGAFIAGVDNSDDQSRYIVFQVKAIGNDLINADFSNAVTLTQEGKEGPLQPTMSIIEGQNSDVTILKGETKSLVYLLEDYPLYFQADLNMIATMNFDGKTLTVIKKVSRPYVRDEVVFDGDYVFDLDFSYPPQNTVTFKIRNDNQISVGPYNFSNSASLTTDQAGNSVKITADEYGAKGILPNNNLNNVSIQPNQTVSLTYEIKGVPVEPEGDTNIEVKLDGKSGAKDSYGRTYVEEILPAIEPDAIVEKPDVPVNSNIIEIIKVIFGNYWNKPAILSAPMKANFDNPGDAVLSGPGSQGLFIEPLREEAIVLEPNETYTDLYRVYGTPREIGTVTASFYGGKSTGSFEVTPSNSTISANVTASFQGQYFFQQKLNTNTNVNKVTISVSNNESYSIGPIDFNSAATLSDTLVQFAEGEIIPDVDYSAVTIAPNATQDLIYTINGTPTSYFINGDKQSQADFMVNFNAAGLESSSFNKQVKTPTLLYSYASFAGDFIDGQNLDTNVHTVTFRVSNRENIPMGPMDFTNLTFEMDGAPYELATAVENTPGTDLSNVILQPDPTTSNPYFEMVYRIKGLLNEGMLQVFLNDSYNLIESPIKSVEGSPSADAVRMALAKVGCMSCNDYDNALINDLVQVTKLEYESLLSTVNNAGRYGESETIMNTALPTTDSFWEGGRGSVRQGTGDGYTKLPKNNLVVGVSVVVTTDKDPNVAGLFAPIYSSVNSGEFYRVGRTFKYEIPGGLSDARIYYVIKTPTLKIGSNEGGYWLGAIHDDNNSSTSQGSVHQLDYPSYYGPKGLGFNANFPVNPMSNGAPQIQAISSPTVMQSQNVPFASAVNFSTPTAVRNGETLSGSYTYVDADSDPEGTSTFQWYRAVDAAGNGQVAIPGATNINYVLQAEDVGKYIAFGVTPVAVSEYYTQGSEVLSAYQGPVSN